MRRLLSILVLLALTSLCLPKQEAKAGIWGPCGGCTVNADCFSFCGPQGGVCRHISRACGPYYLCDCN